MSGRFEAPDREIRARFIIKAVADERPLHIMHGKITLRFPTPKKLMSATLVSSNHDNDHKRRNELFQWSLEYGRNRQLMFASITDCTPEHSDRQHLAPRQRIPRARTRAHATYHSSRYRPIAETPKEREILNNPEYMPRLACGTLRQRQSR